MSSDKGRWAERRAHLMDALRRLGQGERDRPSESGRAYSAADHDVGHADDPPVTSERPFKLRFEDGSERDVPSDGRTFGPN